jgi:tetratricopeptide (TPR) repeat protein
MCRAVIVPVLACLLLAVPAPAADHWIEYRIGPFRIISDAGDKAARDRLNEMEQLRYALGVLLGKSTGAVGGPSATELKTVWPIDVALFANAKQYAPHALDKPNKPFTEGGSAMLGAWTADVPLSHDMLRALTRMLIEENSAVMPEAIETALCDLFSTIKVTGPKVLVGAPLPAGEIPPSKPNAKGPDRMREWARMQMLVTTLEYRGKLRVYLSNLQGGGDVGLATRNAFDMTPAKLDAMVDAYLQAGQFEAVPIVGESLNPNRDFVEKPMDQQAVDAWMAELAAGGKDFPPDSPRGLLEQGTIAAYEMAIKANPRWGEPHFQLAELLSNPVARLAELKTAATLEPRNAAYWRMLAEAQTVEHQYADAEKSWNAAIKAAPDDAERARTRQTRIDVEEKRADFEASEKKRIAEEQARELQRIKDATAAEVHAAEKAINKQAGEFKSNQKPVPWWGDDPKGDKVAGKLARVDCLTSGAMRLTINIDGGGVIRLLIRDPKKLAVHASDSPKPAAGKTSTQVSGPVPVQVSSSARESPTSQPFAQAKFVCGVQRVAQKIRVVYNINADAKLNTVGDVAMVEFP